MKCERLETDMCLKGVATGRDAVDVSWINIVMKGWRINQDSELARGA